jgi:hypothetical protein
VQRSQITNAAGAASQNIVKLTCLSLFFFFLFSALRSLLMLEGAQSMRGVGIQPKVRRPSWPPIAHRSIGESNQFRLGVENQSLRSSRSRPTVTVENRKPNPREAFSIRAMRFSAIRNTLPRTFIG